MVPNREVPDVSVRWFALLTPIWPPGQCDLGNQSAVNIVSWVNTVAKRRAFYYSVHIAKLMTLALRAAKF